MANREQAAEVKAKLIKELWDKPELGGVGLTWDDNDGYAVSVHLTEPLPPDAIPSSVDDVPVDVRVVGVVRASSL